MAGCIVSAWATSKLQYPCEVAGRDGILRLWLATAGLRWNAGSFAPDAELEQNPLVGNDSDGT